MTESKQASSSEGENGPEPAVSGQTKIAAVLALLEQEQGAALDNLVAATGWQPHTARAVLSGLKKKGHAIQREKVDGVSRYRITKGATQ